MICKETGVAAETGFMSRQCGFFAEQFVAKNADVEILNSPASKYRSKLHSFSLPHIHDSWELKLFIGSSSNREKEISQPKLTIVPPYTIHPGTIIKKDSKITMLSISQGQNGLLVSYVDFQKQYHLILETDRLAHLATLLFTTQEKVFATIHSALKSPENKLWKAYGINLLRFFLTALSRELNPQESTVEVSLPPTQDAVTRANQYIAVYYYIPTLTVREIAEYAGVSPGHLSVLFQQQEKTSIRKRLIETRLERARELLLSGRYFIKEVSCLTGWNDQLYFSKAFKKHYGICPKEVSTART